MVVLQTISLKVKRTKIVATVQFNDLVQKKGNENEHQNIFKRVNKIPDIIRGKEVLDSTIFTSLAGDFSCFFNRS